MIDAIELDALRAATAEGHRVVVEADTFAGLMRVYDAASAVLAASDEIAAEMRCQSEADRQALDDAFVAAVERLLATMRASRAANDAAPGLPERAG